MRDPSREILFLGSQKGLETRLVPQAGFPLKTLALGGIAGRSLVQRVAAIARAAAAVIRCAGMYLRRRPAIVVGVGGFVSGPAVAAALLLRVPTLIQEQNAEGVGAWNLRERDRGDRLLLPVKIEDAPEIYYLTEYYRKYPLILARLSRVDRDALHDLLSVSRRLTLPKTIRTP